MPTDDTGYKSKNSYKLLETVLNILNLHTRNFKTVEEKFLEKTHFQIMLLTNIAINLYPDSGNQKKEIEYIKDITDEVINCIKDYHEAANKKQNKN